MAEHGIQKSRHLLKRLEEEMLFLRSLMSQVESLSSQVTFVSSGIKKTWSEIVIRVIKLGHKTGKGLFREDLLLEKDSRMNLLILESLVSFGRKGLRASRALKGATKSRTLDARNPEGTFFSFFGYGEKWVGGVED